MGWILDDKPWYKSTTLWGALGWAAVGALEGLSAINPALATFAKAIAAALIGIGLRRAL